jgi:hypothetical protein
MGRKRSYSSDQSDTEFSTLTDIVKSSDEVLEPTMTLQNFCTIISSTDRRSELISAFFQYMGEFSAPKNTRSYFISKLDEFSKMPA